MSKAIFKCELCSVEVNDGTRLCAACAEMVQRVAHVNAETTRRNESEGPAESLQKKVRRAQAKAEG